MGAAGVTFRYANDGRALEVVSWCRVRLSNWSTACELVIYVCILSCSLIYNGCSFSSLSLSLSPTLTLTHYPSPSFLFHLVIYTSTSICTCSTCTTIPLLARSTFPSLLLPSQAPPPSQLPPHSPPPPKSWLKYLGQVMTKTKTFPFP